jgi:hypothetical protein
VSLSIVWGFLFIANEDRCDLGGSLAVNGSWDDRDDLWDAIGPFSWCWAVGGDECEYVWVEFDCFERFSIARVNFSRSICARRLASSDKIGLSVCFCSSDCLRFLFRRLGLGFFLFSSCFICVVDASFGIDGDGGDRCRVFPLFSWSWSLFWGIVLLGLIDVLFISIKWILGREEAAGGGEEGRREEEELLTGNFGEDNRSEPSRKRTKEKF